MSSTEGVDEELCADIEAEDYTAIDWDEEAETADEEFEQQYIFGTLGWSF